MGSCFVIQPFDGGVFDKRYAETFRPAILNAGLEPYRVDEDPSAAIPIREIERGIRAADVCFAEITVDNPNVWFELGFAIASRKPIVMVCSAERQRFPFDVQHRTIISYTSDAPSDFAVLAEQITVRLKAALDRQLELEDVSDLSAVATTGGFSPHEVTALVSVASYAAMPSELPSRWMVKQDMNRAGFTDIAVTLAVRSLLRRNMIETKQAYDDRGNDYIALDVTDLGLRWLEDNERHLVLRTDPKEPPFEPDIDLPF